MTTRPPAANYSQTRLQGISDLTVIARIKTGFVADALETCTYVERLRRMLKLLDAGRHANREASIDGTPFSDLVGRLNIVHFFRFAIIPPDPHDAAGQHRMLLNVTFDGGWEPYMRVIWRDLGSLLDAICCNCEDYPLAHEHSFDTYIAWVRAHEVPGAFFYADSGDGLGDHRYRGHLEKLALTQQSPAFEHLAATYRPETPRQALEASIERARRSPKVTVLAGLRALALFHSQLRTYAQVVNGDALVLQRFAQDLLHEFLVLVREGFMGRPEFAPLAAQFSEQLDWFTADVPRWTPPPERLPLDRAHILKNIQGGILDTYSDVSHGCLALLRVKPDELDEAIDFLAAWPVTRGDNRSTDGMYRNIALTYRGLVALGISSEHLDALPFEFKEGMEARAGILGDVRSNHPDHWREPKLDWPARKSDALQLELSTVHVAVQLRRKADSAEDELLSEFKAELALFETNGFEVLSVQAMRRYGSGPRTIGHFGFVDGISQPQVLLANEASQPTRWHDAVAPGEVLLGYANSRADGPCPARPNALLDFGSFLVVRKLRQRVDVLNEVLSAQARKHANTFTATDILEKMMGRRQSGNTLGDPSHDANDFNFNEDAQGAHCPFHSHVRRLNPRLLDSELPLRPAVVPRIVRRGMSYGPKIDGQNAQAERGIIFMAYNASIAEQFEVLQRWISGASAHGFGALESDPFMGVPTPGTPRIFRFLHEGNPVCIDLGDKPFVQLEWGMYLFTPSIAALKSLRTFMAKPATPATSKQIVSSTSSDSFAAWQQRVEDPERRDSTWAHIRRAPDGVLSTAYGVLVGSEHAVARVLRDDGSTFSVRGYGDRLNDSIGIGFLGQDPPSQHAHTKDVNRAIAKISRPVAYARATRTAHAVLRAQLDAFERLTGRREGEIVLPKFLDDVLGALCTQWFGIPDGKTIATGGASMLHAPAKCPGHSFAVAQYVFWPAPAPVVRDHGRAQGQALLKAAKEFLDGEPTLGELGADIAAAVRASGGDDEAVAQTLIGVIQGMPPTVALNTLAALRRWTSTRSLWTLQLDLPARSLLEISFDEAATILQPALFDSMRATPVPPMLWRTAMKNTRLGTVDVHKGQVVIASLASAMADAATRGTKAASSADAFMFGGAYGETTHACPGRDMAIGAMIGTICALLKAGTLRPTPNPLIVVLRG